MKKTIVINLIAGPGTGKSTTMAGIYYELSRRGLLAEMASEFAKDKVWEDSTKTLDDQLYIFGKQHHKIWRVYGKVDWVITDSPLLLSIYYNNDVALKHFNDVVLESFSRFDNRTYFLERDDSFFKDERRVHSLETSKEIHKTLKELLKTYHIPYTTVSAKNAVEEIIKDLSL